MPFLVSYELSYHTTLFSSHCLFSKKTVSQFLSAVGATIRYMITGVPPEHDLGDYINSKNHPLKKMIRVLKRGNTKSSKRYKAAKDIPDDIMHLVRALTHYDSTKRATVRAAAGHDWISEIEMHPESADCELSFMDHGGPIEYLDCAK